MTQRGGATRAWPTGDAEVAAVACAPPEGVPSLFVGHVHETHRHVERRRPRRWRRGDRQVGRGQLGRQRRQPGRGLGGDAGATSGVACCVDDGEELAGAGLLVRDVLGRGDRGQQVARDDAGAIRRIGPLGQRAAEVGGLHHGQAPVAGAQAGSSGRSRVERRGVCGVDDVLAVGAVTDPERDAQGDVGPHVGGDDACRALGRQHEMETERPTEGRDAHEARDEVRELVGEGLELVHDDDEAGQRRELTAYASGAPVVVEVARGRPREQPLTALHLGIERGERPRRQVLRRGR